MLRLCTVAATMLLASACEQTETTAETTPEPAQVPAVATTTAGPDHNMGDDSDASTRPEAATLGAMPIDPADTGPDVDEGPDIQELPEIRPVPSRTPTMSLGKAEVTGPMTPAAIESAMKPAVGPLTVCYSDAMVRDVRAEGEVVVAFTVEADATVKDVEIEAEGFDATFVTCLRRTMSNAKFVPREGGTVRVRLPLRFTPM